MASYLGDIFRKITTSSSPSTPISGLIVSKDTPSRGIYKGAPVSVACPASIIHVKRLRTLKHPGIITYVTSDDSNPSCIWLVTESVRPLLETRDIADDPDWAVLLSWQAATTILFLNMQAGIAHCNVQGDCMFLDDFGMFKLGGFDQSINRKDPSEFEHVERRLKEDLDDETFFSIDQPRMLSFIKNELKVKTKAESLAQVVDEFESHRLVQLVNKLDSLHIDPEPDKLATLRASAVFVQNPSAPKPLVFKVLARIWDSLSGTGLSVDTVRVLCQCIGRLVDSSDPPNMYNKKVLEVHSNLLKNNDRAIRLFLIDNLEKLLGKVDDSYVRDSIYPVLTASLLDPTPGIRDASLRTLVSISPRLPVNIVSGELLKHIARLQEDPQAGIRTNVLIGLGKLEERLPEDVRSKIIGPAYSVGLRDPFTPAKIAALNGLLRSHKSCGKEEIATRLLPAVSPLLVDGDREISGRASKLIDLFMEVFRTAEVNSPRAPTGAALVDSKDEKIVKKLEEMAFTLPPQKETPNGSQGINPENIREKLERAGGAVGGKSRLGATRKLQ